MDRREVYRVADVRLRGRSGSLRARAYWPVPADSGASPALLVFYAGTDLLCRDLCSRGRVVVLSVHESELDDAANALEWAAEHAGELGADPGRLLVGGAGAGVGLATEVSSYAKDQGWPPIAGQVLIDSDDLPDVRNPL